MLLSKYSSMVVSSYLICIINKIFLLAINIFSILINVEKLNLSLIKHNFHKKIQMMIYIFYRLKIPNSYSIYFLKHMDFY